MCTTGYCRTNASVSKRLAVESVDCPIKEESAFSVSKIRVQFSI